MCDNLDLSITDLRDGDVFAEVVGAALDLDAIVQEFLKRRQVKDLIADWLAGVDDVLHGAKRTWSVTRKFQRFMEPYLLGDLGLCGLLGRCSCLQNRKKGKTLAYCSLRPSESCAL